MYTFVEHFLYRLKKKPNWIVNIYFSTKFRYKGRCNVITYTILIVGGSIYLRRFHLHPTNSQVKGE